jgi:hypothetical protein
VRLPSSNLGPWAREIVSQCRVSSSTRRNQGTYWRNLYWTGTNAADYPSKHNRCFQLVDTLSSYLFSPSEVKFSITFEADGADEWAEPAYVASRHLNREFSRRRINTAFQLGVDMALVEGCSFLKIVWGRTGYEPHLIRPHFMGVLREDIEDLDRQDAFCHSFWLTPAQFARMIWDKPNREELLAKVKDRFDSGAEQELAPTFLYEVTIGGLQPLNQPGSPGPIGRVSMMTQPPNPQFAPEVGHRLIRVDELWVMDDEQNDWTTIRLAEPDIVLDGEDRHINLSDAPHEHPFIKICPNETPGYMWGRSELANVEELQMLLNARIENIDYIFRMRARPPRAFTGFQGITEEKMRAFLSPNGFLTEPQGQTKIDSLAPEMPQEALAYLNLLDRYFDDAAGLTPILSGRGEQGVRAGVHAGTLVKTGSPRLRDRALLVEGQCANAGDLCLKISQAKDPRLFSARAPQTEITGQDAWSQIMRSVGARRAAAGGKTEFLLANLPNDAEVVVDSHSSSPAFSDASQNLAFALAKAGAIDGDSLIQLSHPPHEDELRDRFRRKQEQEAKLIQAHPELLQKGRRK